MVLKTRKERSKFSKTEHHVSYMFNKKRRIVTSMNLHCETLEKREEEISYRLFGTNLFTCLFLLQWQQFSFVLPYYRYSNRKIFFATSCQSLCQNFIYKKEQVFFFKMLSLLNCIQQDKSI